MAPQHQPLVEAPLPKSKMPPPRMEIRSKAPPPKAPEFRTDGSEIIWKAPPPDALPPPEGPPMKTPPETGRAEPKRPKKAAPPLPAKAGPHKAPPRSPPNHPTRINRTRIALYQRVVAAENLVRTENLVTPPVLPELPYGPRDAPPPIPVPGQEGHYFDSVGNELILLDGQWLLISDGEEDSDGATDYTNDQMDVDEAVAQFEIATAELGWGSRPTDRWTRHQTQEEIFGNAEPEPQQVADHAPAESEQIQMPWQMADGNVVLDAQSEMGTVAEPEAASVAGGSEEPEPAMSVDATQAQPEEEIPIEDDDDTFECKTCTHQNNVGEMYCNLCGTNNMPTYQATEESKEAEKTTFAQILDIRTENIVMRVPHERGSKWTKTAHYVAIKQKKDLHRRACRMKNEQEVYYTSITEMATDPFNENYVAQWLHDHQSSR